MEMAEKLVALLLGLTALCIVLWLCFRDSMVPLEFESLDAQLKQLESVYSEKFGAEVDVMGNDSGRRVVCDFLAYKALSSARAENWEESRSTFNANEMEFVMGTSIHSDYWASLAAFKYLVGFYNGDTAVQEEILKLCADEVPNLRDIIGKEVEMFQYVAEKEGFVDENMKILPEKMDIVRLLHRYQWVTAAGFQFPMTDLMPPEEHLAIFRWQIEQSTLGFDKKIDRIKDFKTHYGYDYDYEFARAVLYFQHGHPEGACSILKDAELSVSGLDAAKARKYRGAMKTVLNENSVACDDI